MIQPPRLEFRLVEDEDGEEYGEYVVHVAGHEIGFNDDAEYAVETLAALEEFGTQCFHAGINLERKR